jgi:hypothetical protein
MAVCVNIKATELQKIQFADFFPHLSQDHKMEVCVMHAHVANLHYILIFCTNITQYYTILHNEL